MKGGHLLALVTRRRNTYSDLFTIISFVTTNTRCSGKCPVSLHKFALWYTSHWGEEKLQTQKKMLGKQTTECYELLMYCTSFKIATK